MDWGNEDGLKPWFPDDDRMDRAGATVAEFAGEGRGFCYRDSPGEQGICQVVAIKVWGG